MIPITPSLDTKIKNLTTDPGVYLMKDSNAGVLYVGKAKNLKSRVSSYFQNAKDKGPRIQLMVSRICDFEVILTDTEVEALILECNLIKKYRPKFNVRLRDDKSYPFVRLDLTHDFPRLEYVRKVKSDEARYFGPYVASFYLKEILRWSQKTFKLRDCSDAEFRNRTRPCILHQMQQCSAPCVNLISKEAYQQQIALVLKILAGKSLEVLKELKAEMLSLSEAMEFEKAAEVRDRIEQIEYLSQKQKVADPQMHQSKDVVQLVIDQDHKTAVIGFGHFQEGNLLGVDDYIFPELDSSFDHDEFLFNCVSQYYLKNSNSADPEIQQNSLLPQEVWIGLTNISQETEQNFKLLTKALNQQVHFHLKPNRAENAVLTMVKKTVADRLASFKLQQTHLIADLADLQKRLHLTKFPRRIECFDISHFHGEDTVASRVVFIDGKPDKKLYRHYHVRSVVGVDDFKSMREILERRFSNDASCPDLIVIDGGKGQLSQVVAIFEELKIDGVDLVSLAKARTKSEFQASEVSASSERVFKPGQKNYILLKPNSGAYRILTQARDESHRFAISFHRKTRDKKRGSD